VAEVALAESFDGVSHRTEQRLKTHSESADPAIRTGVYRSDECAGPVERKRRNIFPEPAPLARLLEEILFDVRKIEDGDCGVMIDEILADRANGLLTGKIAHNRYDQVLHFHLAQAAIIGLGSEIAPVEAGFVRGSHQLGIAR